MNPFDQRLKDSPAIFGWIVVLIALLLKAIQREQQEAVS